MLLVDTSVWVLVFRKHRPLDLEAITPIAEVVTCLPVIQEVLQGFRDELAFRKARSAMLALPIVEPVIGSDLVLAAVDLYRAARKAGLTPRSSVDCLIAACALRHGLPVLHDDRDYDVLARVSVLESRRIAVEE